MPTHPNKELTGLVRVWGIYTNLNDEELEDLREYDTELLQRRFNLSAMNAKYLWLLIQTEFTPGQSLDIILQSRPLEFAAQVRESIHQGMDGWSDTEKAIIHLYLHDLILGLEERGSHTNYGYRVV